MNHFKKWFITQSDGSRESRLLVRCYPGLMEVSWLDSATILELPIKMWEVYVSRITSINRLQTSGFKSLLQAQCHGKSAK